MPKFSRLPNGFGSVTKVAGNRRKPYMARVYAGTDSSGKPKQKSIGYFETRKEALAALADYYRRPFDLVSGNTSLEEIAARWVDQKLHPMDGKQISSGKEYLYTHALENLGPIGRMKISAIPPEALQHRVSELPSQGAQKGLILLLKGVYKYSMAMGYVTFDPTAALGQTKKAKPKTERTPYTAEEIRSLRRCAEPLTDAIIVALMYSGLRVMELVEVDPAKVDLDQRCVICGKKTKAGKGRQVPIHQKAVPAWKYLLDHSGSTQLLDLTYNQMLLKIQKVCEAAGVPCRYYHAFRHGFITRWKEQGLDDKILKVIVGHSVAGDITESVYTHRSFPSLMAEMNKFEYLTGPAEIIHIAK